MQGVASLLDQIKLRLVIVDGGLHPQRKVSSWISSPGDRR